MHRHPPLCSPGAQTPRGKKRDIAIVWLFVILRNAFRLSGPRSRIFSEEKVARRVGWFLHRSSNMHRAAVLTCQIDVTIIMVMAKKQPFALVYADVVNSHLRAIEPKYHSVIRSESRDRSLMDENCIGCGCEGTIERLFER